MIESREHTPLKTLVNARLPKHPSAAFSRCRRVPSPQSLEGRSRSHKCRRREIPPDHSAPSFANRHHNRSDSERKKRETFTRKLVRLFRVDRGNHRRYNYPYEAAFFAGYADRWAGWARGFMAARRLYLISRADVASLSRHYRKLHHDASDYQ